LALHQKPSKKNTSGHKAVERYKAEMEAAARRRELSGIAMKERGITIRERTPPPPPKVVISFYTTVSYIRIFSFQTSKKKKKNSEEDRPVAEEDQTVVKVVILFYTIESQLRTSPEKESEPYNTTFRRRRSGSFSGEGSREGTQFGFHNRIVSSVRKFYFQVPKKKTKQPTPPPPPSPSSEEEEEDEACLEEEEEEAESEASVAEAPVAPRRAREETRTTLQIQLDEALGSSTDDDELHMT
jgi:hypothetical protein